ncbi:MAG TPA: hypothetical protein VGT05_02495 [Patescibacteria group bacterium]|nr:hypothetical protein [Patescibacteria group bacterium]
MQKIVVVLGSIVGFLLIVIAVLYVLEPARSLPQFFPGYSSTLARHHYTHAVAALLLGLGVFAFVWFQSGKKSSKQEKSTHE